MTKNFTIRLFLGFVLVSLAFSSCKKFEGSQEVPSYIHIDSITVNVDDYSVFGANTSNISDAWVYVDDQIIGCFELPSTFPVLERGYHKVTVYGGICVDGRGAARAPYSFYKPMVYENMLLVEDSIVTLNPVLNYYPINEGVVVGWKGDFESGLSLVKTPDSDTNIIRISGNEAWHSSNWQYLGFSGKVTLPPDSLDFKVAVADELQFHNEVGEYCLLEMDYKTNDTVFVGVMYYEDYKLKEWPLVKVLPTDKEHVVPQVWNKIYINLGPFVREHPNASYFKVYITSDLSVDPMYGQPDYIPLGEPRYYYFDNLKVLYRPL